MVDAHKISKESTKSMLLIWSYKSGEVMAVSREVPADTDDAWYTFLGIKST